MLRPRHTRVTFVLAKVTKTVLPRKARRRCRYLASALASGGAHTARPCAGCARTESLRCPVGLDFGLSSTLARLRGGRAKVPGFCCWAPYGAPEHRKALAECLKGHAKDRVGRPPAQGCAVGRLSSQSRGCAGAVAPFRVRLSFGNFSLARQRKVTCRGSATHKYETSPEATTSQKNVRGST